MPKLRLNEWRRDVLREFARSNLVVPEEGDIKKAYEAAKKLVIRDATSAFPKKDMAVLKKYGCTSESSVIWGSYLGGGASRTLSFSFERNDDTQPPVLPAQLKKSIEWKPDTAKAIDDLQKVKQVATAARYKKMIHYTSLIDDSKTLEEVIEVWPAAEQLDQKLRPPTTALSTISSETKAFIKNDNAGAS